MFAANENYEVNKAIDPHGQTSRRHAATVNNPLQRHGVNGNAADWNRRATIESPRALRSRVTHPSTREDSPPFNYGGLQSYGKPFNYGGLQSY